MEEIEAPLHEPPTPDKCHALPAIARTLGGGEITCENAPHWKASLPNYLDTYICDEHKEAYGRWYPQIPYEYTELL